MDLKANWVLSIIVRSRNMNCASFQRPYLKTNFFLSLPNRACDRKRGISGPLLVLLSAALRIIFTDGGRKWEKENTAAKSMTLNV